VESDLPSRVASPKRARNSFWQAAIRSAATLMESLRTDGAAVDFVIGDIRSNAFIEGLSETVRRTHGHVDVLVLNAGAITFAPACDITPDSSTR
jgi:NAD(P)-dependent dehydrogenase (short-subunit alcohol dehydrogenase family)